MSGTEKINSINDIRLEGVSFAYNKRDKNFIKNISLSFQKGKSYALIGYSGSGKSTLLDLMVAIRYPVKGQIFINNIRLRDIVLENIREKISYMNQEPLIFHDTIKKNVCFFNRDSSPEDLDKALKKAAVKDFVYSLPEGIETGLGERGLTISGGERQRIGLARVLLKDSDVLLLDEATNALDYATEKNIYDNLIEIKSNKIIIVAAHRLSAVVNFDEIIVLNKGRVEERGTHHQLIKKKGLYYNLYKLQEVESQ